MPPRRSRRQAAQAALAEQEQAVLAQMGQDAIKELQQLVAAGVDAKDQDYNPLESSDEEEKPSRRGGARAKKAPAKKRAPKRKTVDQEDDDSDDDGGAPRRKPKRQATKRLTSTTELEDGFIAQPPSLLYKCDAACIGAGAPSLWGWARVSGASACAQRGRWPRAGHRVCAGSTASRTRRPPRWPLLPL